MEQKQEQIKNPPQPWLLHFIIVFIINLILIAVWVCIIMLVAIEERSSELQAKYFSTLAQKLTFQMAPGASDAIRYPEAGPSDQRRGYIDLPAFIKRAGERGYNVEAQTRFSPDLIQFCDLGIYPPSALLHSKPE